MLHWISGPVCGFCPPFQQQVIGYKSSMASRDDCKKYLELILLLVWRLEVIKLQFFCLVPNMERKNQKHASFFQRDRYRDIALS